MARNFVGASNEFITMNPGAMANPTYSGIAFGMIWRATTVHVGGLFRMNNSGGSELFSSNPYSDGKLYVAWQGGGFIAANTYAAGVWYCDFVLHGSAAGPARVHRYNFTTAAWTHADGPNASQGGPTNTNYPGTSILVGRYNGTSEDHNGDIAVMGFWSGGSFVSSYTNSANDTAFEGLGLHQNLQAWVNQNPATLWAFNQASVATPVTDLSAAGTATQSAISGTTVVSDPPGFTNSLAAAPSGLFLPFFGA